MSTTAHYLHSGWQLLETVANAFRDPQALRETKSAWDPAIVPGTVAQSLGTKIDAITEFDAKDWWYRCTFAQTAHAHTKQRLRFEGLATLAEVWLNGTKILQTRNMFVEHSCEVTLQAQNELVICFRSLDAELAQKKPRPRWKTALVAHQNLRWIRTTLLGRIPAWTPHIEPVGPWKNIVLESLDEPRLEGLQLQANVRGTSAHLQVTAHLVNAKEIRSANLYLADKSYPLKIVTDSLSGNFALPDLALWWPHTHGEAHLYACHIELKTEHSSLSIDCGNLGFKSVAIDRSAGKINLLVNDVPVFCRGACWTSSDFLSLNATEASLRQALTLAKNAGLNMLRVGGTMTYESEDFYRLCDELGILVWQEFMFANMDYPVSDQSFLAEIVKEARFQVARLHKHPCISVYCGGSEVQQQAAMMGMSEPNWSNEFFDKVLPEICADLHPTIPYFASSPCEGALPFHVSAGISHYFGVGAYRRPLSDAKHAKVKFSTECLAFSNVPEYESMNLLPGGAVPPPHHPLWKARVPRDNGAGWDFEDVRDHYCKELFRLDPIELRSSHPERYYQISRVVTGEVMKTIYAEWRKPESSCGAGLIWFFKDFWPGAGWGIVDSHNKAKPVLHYLRRAWAKQCILMTDEGLDGLQLHVLNEQAQALSVSVGLEVFNNSKVKIASAELAAEIPARGGKTFIAESMLGYFADLSYAYRFGPARHDVVRAYIKTEGKVLSEDFYFPCGLSLPQQHSEHVQAIATSNTDGTVQLRLSSPCFLQSVHLQAAGYIADDNYFHLAPHHEKIINFSPLQTASTPSASFRLELAALNLDSDKTIRLSDSSV